MRKESQNEGRCREEPTELSLQVKNGAEDEGKGEQIQEAVMFDVTEEEQGTTHADHHQKDQNLFASPFSPEIRKQKK